MKKRNITTAVLSTLLLSITALSTACKRESAEPIMLAQSSITIERGEQTKISANPEGAYIWSSSNAFAISVDADGTIEGRYVGSSKITAQLPDGRHAWCTATVRPKYTYFESPLIVLGAHIRNIVALEHRKLADQFSTTLIYHDTNPCVARLYYLFDSNQLYAAAIELYSDKITEQELRDYMAERYVYIGIIDGQICYESPSVTIGIETRDGLFIVRYFIENQKE